MKKFSFINNVIKESDLIWLNTFQIAFMQSAGNDIGGL